METQPMSRILVYTSPARGHLFPMTALALELRGRGHEVAVRTLASDVDLVRAQGLDAAPVDPRVEAIAGDDWKVTDPRAALKAAVRMFTARTPSTARTCGPRSSRSGPTRSSWTSTRGAR
jgi:UDP:flavonoid glycosyltransferase YjiC (YdhE family)